MQVYPKDKGNSAFLTGNGFHQFKVLPFNLYNAPTIFERLMELDLRGLTWSTCRLYLDNVMVLATHFDNHLRNLKEVFSRLRYVNLWLNSKRCFFFQKRCYTLVTLYLQKKLKLTFLKYKQ